MTVESGWDRGVTLPAESLAPFRRLSLYNSPYPAHDEGCAVDLYPDSNDGISPVSGVVRATRTVRTPRKSYAVEHDHLVLVDCDVAWCASAGLDAPVVARVLHVEPGVEPGDRVAVGDSLGEMVRSGFFAPWVDNHVHLGFRKADQNLQRASGSLPVSLPSAPTPLAWDGRGTVVETGETFVVLDRPLHPGDGDWCGLAACGGSDGAGDDGKARRGDGPAESVVGVLDGGMPHYDGGGVLAGSGAVDSGPVSFLGQVVGERRSRDVSWRPFGVRANGSAVTGLSLFCARAGPVGVKIVCPGHELERGEQVTVTIAPE
jgi:hypothetical protein